MIFDIDRQNPEQIAAVEDSGAVYSYGMLCRDAKTVAQAVEKRALVFSLCENRYGALCGHVGFLSTGAVPLLLDTALDRTLLSNLLDCYHPEYLWLPERMAVEFPAYPCILSLAGYHLLKTGYPPTELHPALALLLTTSGSTGSPKLVRQSTRNIHSNAAAIADYLKLTAEERAITTLPMQYTYGLSVIHSHLLAGATLLLTGESVIRRQFWEFFTSQRATSLAGVPFTYELLERAGFFERELPSLRYFTQAGGKLPETRHRRCAEYAAAKGKRFYVMYGQTEATARMGYLPWERALEKCGSMGIAIPGGRFSLKDENGVEITQPEIAGELIYYGENVTLGYAQTAADLARGDERGGVLATGDIARRDAEGFYTIVGRKKRFVKLFGNRVGLDECERLVAAHFSGAGCACLGTDDHLRIFIDREALCGEVSTYLSTTLGIHHTAFETRYIAEIPKNNAGKTLYRVLEELP